MAMIFEWDEEKATANAIKHGIAFTEAGTIFGDEQSITIPDLKHSQDEPSALRGVGLDFFSYGPDLEKILGGKVDFCFKLNKYIKPLVEKECVPLYEQV